MHIGAGRFEIAAVAYLSGASLPAPIVLVRSGGAWKVERATETKTSAGGEYDPVAGESDDGQSVFSW